MRKCRIICSYLNVSAWYCLHTSCHLSLVLSLICTSGEAVFPLSTNLQEVTGLVLTICYACLWRRCGLRPFSRSDAYLARRLLAMRFARNSRQLPDRLLQC